MTASSSMVLAVGENENLIDLYHNGFIICLTMAIIFFIISVALFFVFDIKNLFDMRTGRAEKRKISEMEQENALTGRLINPNLKKENSKQGLGARNRQQTGFSEKFARIKDNMNYNQNAPVQNIPGVSQFPQQTSPQAYAPQPLIDTAPKAAPVSVQTAAEDIQTTLLQNDSMQTTILEKELVTVPASKNETQESPVQQPESIKEKPEEIPAPPPVSVPPVDASKLAQPVHNVAQKGELGKAASSVRFMVGDGETSKLDDIKTSVDNDMNIRFNIIKNIMLVHSQETIN